MEIPFYVCLCPLIRSNYKNITYVNQITSNLYVVCFTRYARTIPYIALLFYLLCLNCFIYYFHMDFTTFFIFRLLVAFVFTTLRLSIVFIRFF